MIEQKEIQVFLVDDDKDDYLITKEILSEIKGTRYTLEWVDNYETAVQIIGQSKHDIYLIDYFLGVKNGLELIEHFVKKGFQKPFVVLTGQPDYETDLSAMRSGATDFLAKRQINATLLERSIRYSIKQKIVEQELRKANDAKDKLFSIVSHDLRGPVGNLNHFLEELVEHPDLFSKDEAEEILKILRISASATFNLLENLLSWARSQIGEIKYKPEKVNLNELVFENVSLLENNAKLKDIKLTSDIPKELNAKVDKNMISTVVRNLISNAIKFTNEGGKVSIIALENGKDIEVSVEDSGIGMDEKTFKKIFDPYTGHSMTGTKGEKGTGLGLNLCKDFVEKNKGKIWVESEVGKGSCFKFTLPLNT